ncbi:MAG: alpha/beta hydrolase [Bacillota bacterium]|nr:alpha/beta hydrolase [Bacillota bacterium]
MYKVTINNEILAYEDIGKGLPILFIHPPGMGRKVFYEQKPLSKHFRLILPDLVGNGDSSYCEKTDITVKRFSDDLISLLDFLGLESTIIFAYSAGGIIAQYLSIHHPLRVQALILSGGYPIVDNFSLKNKHRLGIWVVEKNKRFLSIILAKSHTEDGNYRKILKEHMYKSNTYVWSKYYLESLHFNCKNELTKINTPVLLLYGSKSDDINTYIKAYKKGLTDNQVYVIKGANHQLPTKEPKKVNQIVTGYLLNQSSRRG